MATPASRRDHAIPEFATAEGTSLLGNIPWRYRIPRNGPPYSDKDTQFLFLTGDLDAGVLSQMTVALQGGCLGWVVIPVADSFIRAARKAGPLLMQIDLGSIGMWGIGL